MKNLGVVCLLFVFCRSNVDDDFVAGDMDMS